MDGSAYFNSTYSDDEEDSPEARSLLLEVGLGDQRPPLLLATAAAHNRTNHRPCRPRRTTTS